MTDGPHRTLIAATSNRLVLLTVVTNDSNSLIGGSGCAFLTKLEEAGHRYSESYIATASPISLQQLWASMTKFS